MNDEQKARNMQLALEGKPHVAMSIEEVMEAMEKGESYISEPGHIEQIIRWARAGKAWESAQQQGSPEPTQSSITAAKRYKQVCAPCGSEQAQEQYGKCHEHR